MKTIEQLLTEARNQVTSLDRDFIEHRIRKASAEERVNAILDVRDSLTYQSSQATNCASCKECKHTPLRNDGMGGYVCLTCIDKELLRLQAIE